MVHTSYLTNTYCEQKPWHLVNSYSKYKQKYVLKEKMKIDILEVHIFSSFSERNIVFSNLVPYVSALQNSLLI